MGVIFRYNMEAQKNDGSRALAAGRRIALVCGAARDKRTSWAGRRRDAGGDVGERTPSGNARAPALQHRGAYRQVRSERAVSGRSARVDRCAAGRARASVKQGEIWHVDLEPTRGREQQGRRYVLIVSV